MVVPDWIWAQTEHSSLRTADWSRTQIQRTGSHRASSAESFRPLTEKDPVVALLSHSTKGSAKHADVDKVVEATVSLRKCARRTSIDGEFQIWMQPSFHP